MKTRSRNIEQERMHYLYQLKTKIMNSLYKSEERQIETLMWDIAEENRQLLKCKTPTFFFDGRWWPIKNIQRPKECNRILHHSLHTKVQEVIDSYALKDDSVFFGIETMVGNFLAIAGHMDDLYTLFPEEIQKLLPPVDPKIFNVSKPLSEEMVKEVLSKNKDNLKYFKRLRITRLLLNKAS